MARADGVLALFEGRWTPVLSELMDVLVVASVARMFSSAILCGNLGWYWTFGSLYLMTPHCHVLVGVGCRHQICSASGIVSGRHLLLLKLCKKSCMFWDSRNSRKIRCRNWVKGVMNFSSKSATVSPKVLPCDVSPM
jgi:hypothetical protein